MVVRPPRTFRSYYLSRFWPSQVFIVACLIMLYFVATMDWRGLAVAFVFLQLASVIGCWWGLRLSRRLEQDGL
jgi:uncharacterized membrane protein YqjE